MTLKRYKRNHAFEKIVVRVKEFNYEVQIVVDMREYNLYEMCAKPRTECDSKLIETILLAHQ